MLTIFWLVFILTIVGLIYFRQIIEFVRQRKRLIHFVDKLPGPHAIPLLGCTYQFKWNNLEFSYQLEEWASRYGPNGVCRLWIGPVPVIIITKAGAAQEILDSKILLTKSNQYDKLSEWLGTGLLISTGDKWRSRRKMLTPTFHFNILNGFVDIFAREAQILVGQLERYVDTNQSFDLFPYLKRCALDIICETSMGTKVDAQLNHDSEYVIAVQRMSQLIWKHERLPWFRLKPIWYLSGNGAEFDKNLKLLNDFTRKVISERTIKLQEEMGRQHKDSISQLDDEKKRFAFLDLLLMMQKENKLTDEDIREEVDTFMFEGHDTTSSGMGWTLWILGHHPYIQKKIFAELDEIFGDSDRPITPDDLKEMKYLERCIKEGLRLCPPVPLFARNVTEDTLVQGYTIPKGSTVVLVPIYMHRDDQVYTNPEVFDPDNFLTERVASRSTFSYIPFSAGQRNCIGQKFALMEEKTVLATILRKYYIKSMETVEKCRPLPEIILKPPKGFMVQLFTRRK
uniref:Uncharacterized protein n=1 Tax=Plectus sambesii TaxID=2011161 RepID=A0A914X3Y5_9BILA